MNLEKYFETRKAEIEKEIKELEKSICRIPKDTFCCVNSGNYIKWYVSKGANDKMYLSKKKDAKLAQNLAYRKYASLKIKDLNDEREGIRSYEKVCNSNSHRAEELYKDLRYRDLIMKTLKPFEGEIGIWFDGDYERDPNYQDGLKHKTKAGYNVRSKSEAMIVHELMDKKIPFHYEEKLVISDPVYGEKAFYPDFTCRHPQTGEYVYWEHLGLMSDPDYVSTATAKINAYAKNGIVMGVNLIVTTETRDCPLDIEKINKTIDFYFG